MYGTAALGIGAIITIMNVLNGLFSAKVGSFVSVIVIHATGLAAVSLVLLFTRGGRANIRRVPLYLRTGGVIGVATVFACNYAFTALDASVAVAFLLVGQMAFSVIIDAVRFLGRPRHPITARSLPGLAMAALGIFAMAWQGGRANVGGVDSPSSPNAGAFAAAAAFAAGGLAILSIALNSELGKRIGVLRSARNNYLAGFCTTLVVVAIARPSLAGALPEVAAAGPILALGGGLLGLLMVGASNVVFPRLPALAASLFMFAGQLLAGMGADAVLRGTFDPRKLAGALLILAGMAANGLLAHRPAGKERRPAAEGGPC